MGREGAMYDVKGVRRLEKSRLGVLKDNKRIRLPFLPGGDERPPNHIHESIKNTYVYL